MVVNVAAETSAIDVIKSILIYLWEIRYFMCGSLFTFIHAWESTFIFIHVRDGLYIFIHVWESFTKELKFFRPGKAPTAC